MDPKKFAERFAPYAIQASEQTGIKPELILAQAAAESAWGEKYKGNNLFGIKSHGKPGGVQVATHEVINGQRVGITDSFRSFDTPEDSFLGYTEFVNENPRYAKLKSGETLGDQLKALQASGYATDPNYLNLIGSIAGRFSLGDYKRPTVTYDANSPLNAGLQANVSGSVGDGFLGWGQEIPEGFSALGYDTVRNPSRAIGDAPEPPARPPEADLDLRGPLDKASDAITQGVEGAGNAALGAVQGAAGAIQNAGDAAVQGVNGLLAGLMGGTPSQVNLPGNYSTDPNLPNVSQGVQPGQLNPPLTSTPSIDPYGNNHQGDPNALDPNGPGGFGAGTNVSGSVANGSLRPPLTQSQPAQPAPGAYGFSGANVSGSVPKGSFDPAAYLRANPDVAASGMDPAFHYARFGKTEGRPLGTTDFSGANVSQGVNNGSVQMGGLTLPGSQDAGLVPAPQATQTIAASSAPTISAGSPTQIINDIYQAELGRPAEAGAIAYGNALLSGGKVTAEDFAAQVRNSPEAQARRSSFPSQNAPTISAPAISPTIPAQSAQAVATQGLSALAPSQEAALIGAPAVTPTIPNTGTPEQQIAATYQNVLGRAGDPGEIGYWAATLKSGQNDLNSIVAKFQASDEARTRPAPQGLSVLPPPQATPTIAPPSASQGLSVLGIPASPAPQATPTIAPASAPTISAGSPAQIVNDIYQAELGRPAEAGAIAYGSVVLSGGKVTAADFAEQVRNSPEAQARRNAFPSQNAPTIPAPAASAPVENLGMTPTIGAPTPSPTLGPSFAPTIAPTQVPTIAAPPAITASQGISPLGFSEANVGGALGATPQSIGGFYGTGGATENLGLDLPATSAAPSDFGFSGANVGGFNVNGLPAAPAPAQGPGYGETYSSNFNPQASQNAYLDSQINNANAANNALDAFNAGITPVGQAPLRAGQFVSSTGNPGIYQNASDYNIQTLNLNQQALAQKPAAVIAAKPVAVPRVAQGISTPAPFYGRW